MFIFSRHILISLLFLSGLLAPAAAQDTLRLLFIGDIMCHDAQIASAYDSATGHYDFDGVFEQVSPLFRHSDAAVGNLETTLAGRPYQGYPRFSSPDDLVAACKKSGIGYLVTANNHACDRGKQGILRTTEVLDLLDIGHTGTFRNSADRQLHNLMIIEKGRLRTGILNYTYGTNGLPVPAPAIVNRIDTARMARDILQAQKDSLDKLIVFLHWGEQYQLHPNSNQKKIADFLFSQGVDIIIGSHPHVVQPMEYHPGDSLRKERLVVWSLGNFLSNQRKPPRDGGAMVKITLVKKNDTTRITDQGYYLTWVWKHFDGGKWHYAILPCPPGTTDIPQEMDEFSKQKMNTFMQETRKRLQNENENFDEIDGNTPFSPDM